MNRITKYLKTNPDRKLLIPFFTAGFPTLNHSLDLILTAAAAGADIIEIGVPFSDPLADGPEIQYSSYVALQSGINIKKIFGAVATIRKQSNVPIILMGYYNPILTCGESKFMAAAVKAGVDGLIVPDLSIDEAADYKKNALNYGLSTIFLVAPTSPPERIKRIDNYCSDFVYAVTVTGVTGTGKIFDKGTDNYLKCLQKTLKKKFVAGFGVSTTESAKRMARHSDGIVIGSKLVSLIRESKNNKQTLRTVEKFLTQIRRVI